MFYLTGILFVIGVMAAWANGNVGRGYLFADQICSNGKIVCENPKLLLVAAVMVGVVGLYRLSVRP